MAMLFSPSAARSIEARSERPISRLISWVRPPIRPLHRLAVAAGVGGARQHRVLGGHPAQARALAPARHALGDARRAEHAGAAELDEHRALGVVEPVAGDGHRAELVGRCGRRGGSRALPSASRAVPGCRPRDLASRSPSPGQASRPDAVRATRPAGSSACDPSCVPSAPAASPSVVDLTDECADFVQAGGRRAAARLRAARDRRDRDPGDRRGQRRRPARPARRAAAPRRPLAAPARQRRARPRPRAARVRPAARQRAGAGGPAAAGHLAARSAWSTPTSTTTPGTSGSPSSPAEPPLPPAAGPAAGHGRMQGMTETDSGTATAPVRLSPGDPAPDFTLPDADGNAGRRCRPTAAAA